MSYNPPMALIYQELRQIPDAIVEPLRACIIGPSYDLVRYDEPEEKERGYLGAYVPDVDTNYNWPDRPAGGVVDEDYTRVFVDDALLQYFYEPRGGGLSEVRAVCGYRNRIKAPNINWRTVSNEDGTWARAATLYDRDVRVGDIVKIEGLVNGTPVSQLTAVKGFAYEVVDATIGDAAADNQNQQTTAYSCTVVQTSGVENQVTCIPDGTEYAGCASGRISETYTIVVVQSSTGGDATTARLRVVSGDGNDNNASLTPSPFGQPTAIGSRGLVVVFDNAASSPGSPSPGVDQDDLIAGQTWVVTVTQEFKAASATSGGDYAGPSDTVYIITVTRGSCDNFSTYPQITVTTNTGIDYSGPHNVTGPNIPVSIGSYGVTVSFGDETITGLRYGDIFYIPVDARGVGACKTLILENNLVAGLLVDPDVSSSPGVTELCGVDLSVWLYIKKNIEVSRQRTSTPPLVNWETSSTGIRINSGIESYDSSWTNNGALLPLDVRGGKLYVTCRYLRTSNCNELLAIEQGSSLSDVTNALGPAVPDNPLSLGVYKAVENANGTLVYYVAVCSDNLAGYMAALEVIEGSQSLWGLVPLTYSKPVHDAFKAHVLAQSTPEQGRWRVAFLCKELEMTTGVVTTDPSGNPYLATLSSDPENPGNIVYVETSGANFVTNGVRPGDSFRYHYTTDGWGGVSYTEYIVDEVVNEDTLRLLSGDTTESLVPKKFEIYHPNTTGELASQVAAYARLFNNRRCIVVFPDNPSNAGTEMAGYILAAAIAGLKSGVVPQQGLTNLTVSGFDNMDRTIKFFSESELNTMAEGGVLLVIQDEQTGNIKVRHQLTTDMTSANTRELSITSDIDACSYVYLRRVSPWIGRMNITERNIGQIRTELEATTDYLMSAAETELAGAMIEGGTIIRLEQHPTLLDRLEAEIDLNLPYPLNHLVIRLLV